MLPGALAFKGEMGMMVWTVECVEFWGAVMTKNSVS